ncbi:MAG: cache domain-containing protein [Sulfitobacter sp.]
MKFSLGVVLALCLAGLQLFAVSIVVFSSFLTSERVLLDHARDLLRDAGKNTIEHSRGFLKPAESAAELATRLAESRVVASEDFEQLEKLLFQQLQISDQFSGVYYGDEQGRFVYVMRSEKGPGPYRTKIVSRDGTTRETQLMWRDSTYTVVKQAPDPDDVYDPRARLWYQTAKDKMANIWTDPYIFFTSQMPGITVASPVVNANGILQGVIGVDIGIEAISDFLSRLNIGKSGNALILNRNGDVIAHPDQGLIRAENSDGTYRFASISEIDDPVAQEAFGNLATNNEVSVDHEISSRFKHNGSTYVSVVMPSISEQLPWTIAVYAPEADFTGEIKKNRSQNVWIAVGIAAATGLLGLVLANYINKPVRAFAVRSSLISQGEVSAAEPMPNTYRELERANQTLVQAIAERKKSEAEFGRTFDLASRGMAQIQAKTGRITRVNAKLAALLGYDAAELLDQTIQDLSHPDDPVAPLFVADSQNSGSDYVHEKRYLRKDGTTLWVSENVIEILNEDGTPMHAVVTFDDITARKAAELEIQKLNLDLLHSSRVNMMGQMATSLAHELNQPLLAITQNMDAAQFVLRDPAKNLGQLETILRETDGHAHRAGDIIKALRGFVKKEGVGKTQFDFNALLEQTLNLVRPEAKEQKVSLRTVTQVKGRAFGSRVQIAQVLVNLLRNAIESIASQEEGQRLVELSADTTEAGLHVSITDSGPGFTDKFDPFVQFKTTKSDGMGLGLSICRTIVDAHGGKIWYQTTTSGQSQFCFTLPALSPKHANEEHYATNR